ncbi:DUF1700 domain-containing protein [Clostridium sp. SHJSY1]|uniref:HAAS domain-containing protein n=1 Tax=Clostridium sp. SHJSY1 TaxID=2942483 RepID=UPI002874FC4C|nr:DUF1700 domain-containing protein [Clostridium sp. SHJSY1]MDS0526987.1 DUF1700 domain-containing protein [Clostridium sp. SHJSY1]
MDNFEVLGVNKNSSLEEIKLAYENKVKDIDRQVTNEKNAEAFKKVLKDAYDGIISNKSSMNENGQALGNTTVMSKDEIDELLDSTKDEFEEDYYDDNYDYEETRVNKKTRKRRSSSGSSSKKRSKGKDDEYDKEKSKNRKRKKDKDYKEEHDKHHHKEESSGIFSFLMIPLKILVIPIIIVLSIIILILEVISIAVWIVSKVLFIASIAVASVYGYQVYTGSAPMRYDLFAACGAAFILGILLPLITKIFRAPLKEINNSLKDFVF